MNIILNNMLIECCSISNGIVQDVYNEILRRGKDKDPMGNLYMHEVMVKHVCSYLNVIFFRVFLRVALWLLV